MYDFVKNKSRFTPIETMLDSEELRPVILAMAIYLIVVAIVPRIAKKPTGVRVIDDLVMHVIAQRDSAMSGVILVGAVAYTSRYLEEYI
jgi:hypothetical protein